MSSQAAELVPGAWSATPYCGVAPAPAELALRWNFDPVLTTTLAALIVAVLLRNTDPGRRLALGGLALLAVAFVSPLCALASALFSARVVHHALLVAAAAPLLAYGLRLRPGAPLAVVTLLHAVLFWIWHAPGPYAAALASDGIYWTMQACLLGSALAFWSAVRQSEPLPATGALLFTMVQTGLLGAVLTFAPTPLYAPHAATTAPWGLNALQDQQLAGLIMWAPMAGLYLASALWLVGRVLPPRVVAR